MSGDRRSFLGGLFAMLGMGQQGAYTKNDDYGRTLSCTKVLDGDTLKEFCAEMECGPGEERCPLGHCQKPSKAGLAKPISTDEQWFIDAHICSTCGIVYVPPAIEGRK